MSGAGLRMATLLVAGALAGAEAPPASSGDSETEGFQWGSALLQAGFFLGIQHSFRFATEPGTRAELKGPFLRDWGRSLKGLRGWGDSDPLYVNYVGHTMMGGVTGFIYVQNDPGSRTVPFNTPEYWRSRLRALGWSAVYSAMFEIGPASEASLGNVGLLPHTAGMVDFVVTPLAGTGLLALEDGVDKHIIRRLEMQWENANYRRLMRMILNPSRSMANMLRFKRPWHRDNR